MCWLMRNCREAVRRVDRDQSILNKNLEIGEALVFVIVLIGLEQQALLSLED